LAAVFIIAAMAGVTIHGRAFENIVDMALLTGNFGMPAFQLECGQIVIKLRRLPTIRRMASRAIPPKPALMRITCRMTRKAILRRGP
jgi:hypothetical protein